MTRFNARGAWPIEGRRLWWVLVLVLPVVSPGAASAVLYSYTNAEGQYVISQSRPTNRETSYAVLSDDGDYIRTVPGRDQQIPISHWRPWYLPKEPDPFDAQPQIPAERTPVITVEEQSAEGDGEPLE